MEPSPERPDWAAASTQHHWASGYGQQRPLWADVALQVQPFIPSSEQGTEHLPPGQTG